MEEPQARKEESLCFVRLSLDPFPDGDGDADADDDESIRLELEPMMTFTPDKKKNLSQYFLVMKEVDQSTRKNWKMESVRSIKKFKKINNGNYQEARKMTRKSSSLQ